jgi:hypothetical protein
LCEVNASGDRILYSTTPTQAQRTMTTTNDDDGTQQGQTVMARTNGDDE